ncbi:MAG TPA: hypothetical protein VML55_11785, partial [Planctomycetaceae bacterium]|nr:hypothetical protein [Planctomycetaceae bacterium]
QGTADSLVSIVDSDVSFNGEEGIYVVNTASTAQNQLGPAPTTANPSNDPTHGMDATGAITADPRLRLFVIGNLIDGTGRPLVGGGGSTFFGTGLVIRVGTSDGGYGFQNGGGFASDGLGNQINGGILADVVNNSFSGNFGDDIYIESFTSTVTPATTAGTWTDTEFTVDNYVGDPLARLDLTFMGNTFDSTDMNNLGAFYNNAEAVFKSRDDQQTDPGPFTSGTRRRNAQRLGDRDDVAGLLPPATPGGLSDTFLYPGMGESTFRVSGTSDLAPFILDDQPYLNFTDANGVLLVNPIFGELPYGWSIFP